MLRDKGDIQVSEFTIEDTKPPKRLDEQEINLQVAVSSLNIKTFLVYFSLKFTGFNKWLILDNKKYFEAPSPYSRRYTCSALSIFRAERPDSSTNYSTPGKFYVRMSINLCFFFSGLIGRKSKIICNHRLC